jgi:hypothetical protein
MQSVCRRVFSILDLIRVDPIWCTDDKVIDLTCIIAQQPNPFELAVNEQGVGQIRASAILRNVSDKG